MKTTAQRIAKICETGIDGPALSRGDVAGAYRDVKSYNKWKDAPSFFTRKPRRKDAR